MLSHGKNNHWCCLWRFSRGILNGMLNAYSPGSGTLSACWWASLPYCVLTNLYFKIREATAAAGAEIEPGTQE
jgi:hypothetical protein